MDFVFKRTAFCCCCTDPFVCTEWKWQRGEHNLVYLTFGGFSYHGNSKNMITNEENKGKTQLLDEKKNGEEGRNIQSEWVISIILVSVVKIFNEVW